MSSYQIIEGDCRIGLKSIATGSIQTCISSPPYWNLRDYGTAGQIGLEAIPDCLAWARQEPPCGGCFVCEMRSVYGAELRRALAADGTVWINLGDSYTGSRCGGNSAKITGQSRDEAKKVKARLREQHGSDTQGLADKNLVGIPWRVGLALQADGWILRSDIIWNKPYHAPESVRDRPTRAHEYILLLSKQRKYYYDADAIAEPAAASTIARAHLGQRPAGPKQLAAEAAGHHQPSERLRVYDRETKNKRTVWTVPVASYPGAHFATFPPALILPCVLAGSQPGDTVLDLFNGSGTTGLVALQQGRNYVGCELNPDYITLTHERLRFVQPVFQF